MDCDSFVLSIGTQKKFNDLKNLEDLFFFSNLNGNHELFSIKSRKSVSEIIIETPENIRIDEFVALRSQCYAFKCGGDSRNKLKVIF